MNPLTAALEEYANPRNWTRIEPPREGWISRLLKALRRRRAAGHDADGWVFIDDAEPWGRAADALAKGTEGEAP